MVAPVFVTPYTLLSSFNPTLVFRSMRKNPYEGTGKALEEVDYAGDNFVR